MRIDGNTEITTKLEESNMYFTKNQNSNRFKGCVLLQIEINENQYLSLLQKNITKE